jgi:Flp pilus assembly protein TadD
MLLAAKQYALAGELLEQAAAEGPSTGVELDLAIAAFHTAGPGQGLRQLDRVPESARSGDYYLARAYMLDASGKPEEAVAAQILPQDREIPLMKATTLELAGDSAGAGELLDEIQNRWPEWHAVWVARGVVLARRRDFEAAR